MSGICTLRKAILIATIAGVVLVFGTSQDTCNDVWGHALNGKIIMEKGHFPKFSDYSFVQRQDVTLNKYIVPALLFHFLLSFLGYSGLVLFKTVAIAIIVTFMLMWLREEGIPLEAGVYAVAGFAIVAQSRFLPRGDLLNIAFFSIYLYLLARNRRCRDRVIWILPLLQLLWIQFHDLACLGIFAILAHAAEGIIAWTFSQKKSHKADKMSYNFFLLKLAGLCFLASFLNFSTYHRALYPLYILWEINNSKPELYNVVPEFYPILHFGKYIAIPRPSISIRYAVSLLLALFMLVVKRDRLNAAHAILFIVLSVFTFRFIRLVGLYALVAVPLTVIYFWDWLGKERKIQSILYPCAILLNASVITIFATGYMYRMVNVPLHCSFSISQDIKPVRAVEFIRKHRLSGNIYSSYGAGGFVGYQLYPDCKIFIHSLSSSYSYKHFLYYNDVETGKIGPLILARDYEVDIFLIDHDKKYAIDMIKSLKKSTNWSLVYLDDLNVIFIRKDRFPEKAQKFHIDLNRFFPADEQVSAPFGFYRLGGLYMGLEKYDRAKAYYQKSLGYGLFKANIYNTLGVISQREGNYRNALKYFVMSAELEQSDMTLKNMKKILDRFSLCNDNLCKKARRMCQEAR